MSMPGLPFPGFYRHEARRAIGVGQRRLTRLFGRRLNLRFFENSFADGFAFARTRTLGGKHSVIIENFRRMSDIAKSTSSRLPFSAHAMKFSDFRVMMNIETRMPH